MIKLRRIFNLLTFTLMNYCCFYLCFLWLSSPNYLLPTSKDEFIRSSGIWNLSVLIFSVRWSCFHKITQLGKFVLKTVTIRKVKFFHMGKLCFNKMHGVLSELVSTQRWRVQPKKYRKFPGLES